ncbi:hypothetical protein [Hymenobacter fodinae]|uniref:Uncharacterized protein n=1 Tax=Hymenobacter fodinae TaxID=2510796 RepID=A0A4Z0P8Y9_9BACT|nr:hypothetical protein [Hymenobacter fodinae]TGE07877.1 hypothetical protein EU556_09005 [Hymenobacter fodinae]
MERENGETGDDTIVVLGNMSPAIHRLLRTLLWILLIVLPISYCLLIIAADFNMLFGWFFLDDSETDADSLIFNTSIQTSIQAQEPELIFFQITFRLAPLWIGFASAVLVLLAADLLAYGFGKRPLLKSALSNRQLAGQLLTLLLVAYLMGTLIH